MKSIQILYACCLWRCSPYVSLDEGSEGRKHSVHFADHDKNQAKSASLSEQTENKRPRSGKVNLKNVRARIDSNLSHKNRNDEIKNYISSAARDILAEKPIRPSISTVTVEYFDDILEEVDAKKIKKKPKTPEVESMMSRLGLCEEEKKVEKEEEEEEGEKKDYRMTSLTCFDRLDVLREKALKVKTVKTLRFGGSEEREVVEEKQVTDIPQTFVKARVVYVAPKPKVIPKPPQVKPQPQAEVVKSAEKIKASLDLPAATCSTFDSFLSA